MALGTFKWNNIKIWIAKDKKTDNSLQLSSFDKHLPTVVLDFSSWLAKVEPNVSVVAYCCPLKFQSVVFFDMLLFYKEWLFAIAFVFQTILVIFLWSLPSTKCFHPLNCCSLDVFVSHTILKDSKDWLTYKSEENNFSNT